MSDLKQTIWTTIVSIGAVLGIVVVIFSVAFYVFTLNDKLDDANKELKESNSKLLEANNKLAKVDSLVKEIEKIRAEYAEKNQNLSARADMFDYLLGEIETKLQSILVNGSVNTKVESNKTKIKKTKLLVGHFPSSARLIKAYQAKNIDATLTEAIQAPMDTVYLALIVRNTVNFKQILEITAITREICPREFKYLIVHETNATDLLIKGIDIMLVFSNYKNIHSDYRMLNNSDFETLFNIEWTNNSDLYTMLKSYNRTNS